MSLKSMTINVQRSKSMKSLKIVGALMFSLILASCAPSTQGAVITDASPSATGVACQTNPIPKVAVIEFANTTNYYGVSVTGVESAATARLITLLKNSGCYEVIEKSQLQELIEEQGLESTSPEDIAAAAGAAYVVTGAVTEATIDKPSVSLFGVSAGSAIANIKVDVRATDVISGQVVVSKTGAGSSQNGNFSLNTLPIGPISYDDPEVGPLLAAASDQAVGDVVLAIRQKF
jgi:curli biogenesis system outer membrane secretion channel CsgG